MKQKVREITMKIVVLDGDEQRVADSLDEWFYGHEAPMRRTDCHKISIPREPTVLEIADFMLEDDE